MGIYVSFFSNDSAGIIAGVKDKRLLLRSRSQQLLLDYLSSRALRQGNVVRNLQAGNVKFLSQKEVARLQDLLHGDSISPLTGGTSYAPPNAEREVSVATENGKVKDTAIAKYY